MANGHAFLLSRDDQDRYTEVTWLELFYDLIFVAAIIQLGRFLSGNLTLAGGLMFVFLFVVLWSVWAGNAFFFNRYLVDNVPLRILVFVQIFAVGSLAIAIGDAAGLASGGVALAVAAVRLILALLYLAIHRREPRARPLTRRYVVGFAVVAALWFASAFAPGSYRTLLWLVALGLDVYVVLSPGTRRRYPLLPLNVPRLSERFGQFTLIVLGESFIKMVDGLAAESLSLATNFYGAVAFLFIVTVWWTYFEDVAGSVIREGASLAWIFLHLPLMLGVTAMGAALRDVVLVAGDGVFDVPHRVLLYGAIALAFAAITVLDLLRAERQATRRHKLVARLATVTVFALLASAGLGLTTPLSLGLAVAACLVQVVVEVRYTSRSIDETRAVPAEVEAREAEEGEEGAAAATGGDARDARGTAGGAGGRDG